MSKRDDFFKVIQPHHLYFAAAIFTIIALVLVAGIYLYLYRKKNRFFVRQAIMDILDEWISEALMVEPAEFVHHHQTPQLLDYFEDESNRQFALDQLINIKKNFTGNAGVNIVRLYEQLNFRYDSIEKFRSPIWHKKAKGIYELGMMNQHDMHDEVYREVNNKNELVRTEAQAAIIAFRGFEGLSFLSVLTYPLNGWQQIKILEQLRPLDMGEMNDLPQWLQSENEYVVLFALRLAEIYQQFQVHDLVAFCLAQPDEKLRRQAIKTLGCIPADDTSLILKNRYWQETPGNKRMILKEIGAIGSEDDVPFLLKAAAEQDEVLQTEAVRALYKCCGDKTDMNVQLLATPVIAPTIVKQVQYEMS